MNINPELQNYIESHIIPLYDQFDMAHQREHAQTVINQSMQLAEQLDVDADMVYAIAAFHDIGLCEGREHHHQVSARMFLADTHLPRWFSPEQLTTMAEAVEDHRASAKHPPRSIYGRIVAEADRLIDPDTVIRRTIQFGLEHYPHLSTPEQYDRMVVHLHEKYGRNGYLKLWFPQSPNTERLELLRQMIENETILRQKFYQFL